MFWVLSSDNNKQLCCVTPKGKGEYDFISK